ncbi:MAG: hypothetical protein IE887_07630 [Campylobacterales bacterium]|nr:hypothetical protein [Campylobacterales bacterium]
MKTWRYVGAIMLTMLFGLIIWLFLSNPLLINPFVVLTRLNNDSIPDSTITLMADMLPVAVLMCIVLTVTVVLFAFITFSNEKKYLTIIQRESHKTSFSQQDITADAGKPLS